jgi:hypothetical protein
MSTIVENIKNISLQKLSWLAAVPISLASYGAITAPVKASEYYPESHHKTTIYAPVVKYINCNRWEYRHDYRCASYYRPRYEENYNRYDKDYRYHRDYQPKKHHSRYE